LLNIRKEPTVPGYSDLSHSPSLSLYLSHHNYSFLFPHFLLAVAVQSLVLKKAASKIMDDLQMAGATDILLFSISNSRM
jgi:HisG, C-terminal domain